MKPLFESCVYTIALPWRLVEASRDGTSLREGRRWVTGRQLLREAGKTGANLPVVFADSRDCSKLIAWSLLSEIKVGPSNTRYKIEGLWALSRKRPQDLRLNRSGKHIAKDFIRPYALCHTPKFLIRAAQLPRVYPRPFRNAARGQASIVRSGKARCGKPGESGGGSTIFGSKSPPIGARTSRGGDAKVRAGNTSDRIADRYASDWSGPDAPF